MSQRLCTGGVTWKRETFTTKCSTIQAQYTILLWLARSTTLFINYVREIIFKYDIHFKSKRLAVKNTCQSCDWSSFPLKHWEVCRVQTLSGRSATYYCLVCLHWFNCVFCLLVQKYKFKIEAGSFYIYYNVLGNLRAWPFYTRSPFIRGMDLHLGSLRSSEPANLTAVGPTDHIVPNLQ